MFRIFFFFFSLFSLTLFSQKELTLSDAIFKQWTDFYPEKISNLQWQKTQDFYSYIKDNCLLIFDEKNNLIDQVCLDKLKGVKGIFNFPNIKWVTNHSFKFEHENQIFLFNTKRGSQPVLYLQHDKHALNKDYNFIRNLLAYTIENNLFIADPDTNFQINNSR